MAIVIHLNRPKPRQYLKKLPTSRYMTEWTTNRNGAKVWHTFEQLEKEVAQVLKPRGDALSDSECWTTIPKKPMTND